MKQTIVVGKFGQGIVLAVAVLFLLAAAALAVWAKALPITLLCVVWGLLTAGFAGYYSSHHIQFAKNKITRKVFGKVTHQYSYHQIRKVVFRTVTAENGFIRLTFTDGRELRFRMEDRNGPAALKELKKHCSVQEIS